MNRDAVPDAPRTEAGKGFHQTWHRGGPCGQSSGSDCWVLIAIIAIEDEAADNHDDRYRAGYLAGFSEAHEGALIEARREPWRLTR